MKRVLSHISTGAHWSRPKTDRLFVHIRSYSSKDAIERRSYLFTLEQKRQKEAVGRIEKIEIKYMGVPRDATLIMNKHLSTPYDCSRHLGELHTKRSALALLDGCIFWDMNKPLTQSCTLELQHFLIAEPQQVNRVFWRSCSYVLGACAMVAFKDKVDVLLHTFPTPDLRSGSFVYDVVLENIHNWVPTRQELRTLSAEFLKLAHADILFERLDVSEDLALEMFKENEFKSAQIPNIAMKNEGNVTLYRMGTHVDISKGPMLLRSGQIGRATVTAVHQIPAPDNQNQPLLYRFQGVALPIGIKMDFFSYSRILEARAAKLNPARTPYDPFYQNVEFPHKKQVLAA